jgi:hypothetical protein
MLIFFFNLRRQAVVLFLTKTVVYKYKFQNGKQALFQAFSLIDSIGKGKEMGFIFYAPLM